MHFSRTSSRSRLPLPRLLTRRRIFTPEEVRERLRLEDVAHPRTAAVLNAAARTAIWSALLPPKVAADLGRTSSRLATIIYWHRVGVPAHEIGRRLSPFGSAWDAERALHVASELIAETLNRPGLIEQAA